MQNIFSLLLGLVLSFFGQLPIGILSITATQIAVQENFREAWKYSIGVALVEVIYLRLVLSGLQWIIGHPLFFTIFNWITVVFFAVFGLISFITAQKREASRKALLLNNQVDRFLLGMSMSALNPSQVPFWLIWTGYFLNQGLLKPGIIYFNFFTLGSGLGTLGGLMVYMYGGNWLVMKMKTSNRALNKIMGIIFIIAALAQLYRIVWP
jgi:threonine/homoserine/homoserine lactone efflux protein